MAKSARIFTVSLVSGDKFRFGVPTPEDGERMFDALRAAMAREHESLFVIDNKICVNAKDISAVYPQWCDVKTE